MARLAIGLTLFLIANVAAQELTIRTHVPLVVIPASVTNPDGQFVYGLTSADFVVLDNGARRAVRVDEPDAGTAPLHLVVLVQTSDISESALLKIRKVGTMVQETIAGANGLAAVITFADQVTVAQDFTGNEDSFSAVFSKLHSIDTRKGRLIDAVAKGLELITNSPRSERSVLLIIGESKDRGSETQLQDLLPRIQRSGVTMYSLAYSAYLTPFTTRASEYTPPQGGRG